jgi:hypothetical protein
MTGAAETNGAPELAAAEPHRRRFPRVVSKHVFLAAFVVLVLIGGALRFIPTSTAALPGSSSSAGSASTACAAT